MADYLAGMAIRMLLNLGLSTITVGDNTAMYVLLAKDWIMDSDAPEGKAFKYWKAMKY